MNFDVAEKYGKAYFMPPEVTYDWVKKDAIEKPPIWCSVDLRDGNQALIEPMSLEEKIEFFQMLVDIGFKEINSTSVAQREQVFKKSREEVKKLAVDGAILLRDLAAQTDGNFTFEYSPESFPGTEVDYAVEVCNAVLDVWKPDKEHKAIINIPTTVQIAMPHVFACQITLSLYFKCL